MALLSVFVACPYKVFPLDDYKKSFESVGKSLNVSFKFADEQITNQHVLTKITNYIRDHHISLFDITGWNPNVSLELGIAVGLGKRYFILLNQHLDTNKDVPSDIKGIDRLQYSSNSELEAKLILLIKQELPLDSGRSDPAFDALRALIIDVLKKSPGVNIIKLAEAVGEDKYLVQAIVRSLAWTKKVKTQGQTRAQVYFINDEI